MWIYILQSLKNGRYYIGSSKDVKVRLNEFHNKGKVKATKYQRPWIIVFKQKCKSETIAKQIEAKLKSYKSRRIIESIVFSGSCDLVI